MFDPDRSVVDAIGLVFDSFRRMGSAMAVVKWMHRENIELPARPRSGPAHGELRWALPRVAQIARILRNPRYAGAFVYGRTHVERRTEPEDAASWRWRTGTSAFRTPMWASPIGTSTFGIEPP